jgi:acyl-CoA synthetase (AMP-forming)/AMP-acid ligase II
MRVSKFFERLQQHGEENADRIALWHCLHGGRFSSTTYVELAASARSFAGAFNANLESGQIIPMVLARTPDCIAAIVGALGAGCVFSCINQKLRPPQIELIFLKTSPPIALIDGPGLFAIKDAISRDSPIARTRWWLLRGDHFTKTHEKIANKLTAVAEVEEWDPVKWSSDAFSYACDIEQVETGCCLFTSGSTGSPKGVLINRRDLEARMEAEVIWFDLRADDRLLSLLPFSFDVGLNQLMSFIWIGCELTLLDSWFSRDVMNAVEERKITGICAVPAIWQEFLINGQAFETNKAHASLRFLTVSGGALSRRDLDRLPGIASGVGIFKTYGQTEAFRGTSLRPTEFDKKRESVGRAFFGTRVYVVRDSGQRANPNEIGEVVITGLGVMRGYLDGSDPQNKLRLNPFFNDDDPSEMAVFTGDQGYLDGEEYLYLSGRCDDMVKIRGNRVYPNEIREQLLSIDGVANAEVISIKRGDDTRLVAFLVGNTEASIVTTDTRMQMQKLLPTYMIPEFVAVKHRIPLTASGKPDRPLLEAEAVALIKEGDHDA